MFGLGVTELIIILVIIMIMFGAGRLPEIGEGLGRGIRNFRRSVKQDEIDVTPENDRDERDDSDENGASSDREEARPKRP